MDVSPSLISFVGRSKKRRGILTMLSQKPLSQREIRSATSMYKSHVSRSLKELIEKKLVVCQNPKDRAFKFYKITSLGAKVIQEVNKLLG